MFLTKRLTVILFVMLICNFATVSHAEEVDSYFAWVIKDYYKYAPYGTLFDKKPNTIIDMRNDIYKLINQGQYSSAADKCETVEAYQKIILGENYFDEGLTELIAKLYLMSEDFDKAEQKINLLLDNAQDNLTKLRTLNLKSDFCNCRGNYQEALKITQDVAKILQSVSDEKLSLINQARASRAYCGLNETQKSLEIAAPLLPQMQVAFGNANIEILALMSTMFEDYRKERRYEDCEKILTSKMHTVNEYYGNTNPLISAETVLQLAYLYFETNRPKEAENSLNTLLQLAFKLDDDEICSMSRRLYKPINEVSTKYLRNNNPIVLKSELGLARMHNNKGDIQQSINLCNKNLSKFKEVFGVQSNEALALMKILSKNYILLGKYSDAERVINETLTVCRDNFGDYDVRTIESLIALSDIYCRTGKYTSADALLTEIKTDSQEILENKPLLHYDFLFTKSILKLKTGAYLEGIELFNESNSLERKPSVILKTEEILENLRIVSDTGFLGTADEATIAVLNIGKKALSEYHPKMLEIMNELAESYVAQGKLINAETLTKQVFELSREHFGENNFYEWLALNTLSKIRRAEGNFADALAIDEQALQVIEKVRGQNSLEYLISLDSIASDHALAEDFVEAIKIREQALSEYEEIVEAGDTNLLRMMTSLAENYISIKEYAEAENLCDQALAKQPTSIYVDNHISFSKNIMNLFRIKATAQSFSGDNISAAKNYEQLIQAYEIKRNSFNNNGLIISSKGKSQWFAEIIPDYKNAADTAQKAGNMNFAFYCAEFCKGRSPIDRYNDVLVSRNYSLNPYDRKHIADYKKLIPACRLILESDIARNDDTLRSNVENTYFRLSRENEEFKQKLREEYSNNLVPKDPQKRAEVEQKLSQWEESLKSFDISKNRQAIPNGACLVEFMKVSDDCLLVMFLRNDSDVQAVNISVDKNFFNRCWLYHDLNSYADINALHNDGKYL